MYQPTWKGVDSALLDPRQTWVDRDAYDQTAHSLIEKFKSNFEKFDVAAAIEQAGPQ